MNCLYGPDKIELPDIRSVYTPELQKKYPNAVVSVFTELYYLCLYSAPVSVDWNPFSVRYLSGDVCSSIAFTFSEWGSEPDWVYSKDGDKTEIPAGEVVQATGTPVWANFALYNVDGTLRIAASDPIPVGSAPEVEPIALTMGIVGRIVRGLRGK